MGEDPLGDRSEAGEYTANQGDDPESSLDDLASAIQDRDDAAVDPDGSLDDLANDVSRDDASTAARRDSDSSGPGVGETNAAGSTNGDEEVDGDRGAGPLDDPLGSVGTTSDSLDGSTPGGSDGLFDGSMGGGSTGGGSTGDGSSGTGASTPFSTGSSGSASPFGGAGGSAFGSLTAGAAGDQPRDPSSILEELDEAGRDSVSPEVPGRDASNVLVLGPLSGCERQCVEHLTAFASTQVNALFVSVSQSVDERLEAWQHHAGGYPANAALVTIGARSQAGGSSAVIETRAGPDRITVDAVSDPADLTRLGITLTRRLEEWETNPYPTVVCLHSLTELLQYVELRRLFRFVHVLQNTLKRVDGMAHFHLDPEAHGERTVRLFQTLVDQSEHFQADN